MPPRWWFVVLLRFDFTSTALIIRVEYSDGYTQLRYCLIVFLAVSVYTVLLLYVQWPAAIVTILSLPRQLTRIESQPAFLRSGPSPLPASLRFVLPAWPRRFPISAAHVSPLVVHQGRRP